MRYSLFDSWGRFVGYLVPNYSGCVYGWVLFLVLSVFGFAIFAPLWLIWSGLEAASKGRWGTALICWALVVIPVFTVGSNWVSRTLEERAEEQRYIDALALVTSNPEQAFTIEATDAGNADSCWPRYLPCRLAIYKITNNTEVGVFFNQSQANANVVGYLTSYAYLPAYGTLTFTLVDYDFNVDSTVTIRESCMDMIETNTYYTGWNVIAKVCFSLRVVTFNPI